MNRFRSFLKGSPRSGEAILATWLGSWLLVTAPAAIALPQEGRITHGQGSISQTSATHLQIQQDSQRMAADFESFDIGARESVNIAQPGRSAMFLGRVTGESATSIFGTLTANGSVMLVNPRGVVFGPGARVDTASLIATTLGVSVEQFISGALELEFSADAAGRILNQGVLNAAAGGSVTLLGDEVINDGLIVAELGRVDLASGSAATLTFDQEGLIGLEVTRDAIGGAGASAAVTNSGEIDAPGGRIFLTASAARDLFTKAVNNEGILRANAAEEVNGEIRLFSAAGDSYSSGTIEATSDTGTGGTIEVLGDRVAVTDGRIDASGATGGGEIRVGGAFQGKGETPTADRTFVGPDAVVRADATVDGDGGEVIFWGDTEIRYFGRTSAQGGPQGGDGGFVEVSSKDRFTFEGQVDTTAPAGQTGTLLLDPADLFIVNGVGGTGDQDANVGADDQVLFGDADIGGNELTVGALQALGDTNITLQATNRITVGDSGGASADVDLAASLTTQTLTLDAGNGSGGAGDITFNAGSRIETGGGSVVLNAGLAGDTSGAATLGEIVTAGGALTVNALTTVSANAPISTGGGTFTSSGTDFATSAASTVNTAGGDLNLDGHDGAITLGADVTTAGGDLLANSATSLDSTGGALSTAGGNDAAGGAVTITTTTGAIAAGDITAAGGAASGGTAGQAGGVIELVSAGDISFTSLSADGSAAAAGSGLDGGEGGVIRLTRTDAADLVVDGALSALGGAGDDAGATGTGGLVALSSGATIDIGSGATLASRELSLSATTSATSDGPGVDIDVLGASVGVAVALRDENGFDIGSVDGGLISGVTGATGSFNVGGGTLTQSAAIDVDTLVLQGANASYLLGDVTNTVDNLLVNRGGDQAATLVFGNANGYSFRGMNVAGDVTLTTTAGVVLQDTASPIDAIAAGTLDLDGGASYTLDNVANDITTLNAASVVPLGELRYTDANAFDIAGINAGTNAVTLHSASGGATVTQSAPIIAGSLTLNGAAGTTYVLDDVMNAVTSLDADNEVLAALTFNEADGYDIVGIDAAGLVTLSTTAGSVTQSGAILAASLDLNGAASYTLETATNDVTALSGSTTGSVSYTDANAFDVAGLSATSVTLSSASGADTVTQSGAITTGALVLGGAAGTMYTLGDAANAVDSLAADNETLAGLTFGEADGYDIVGVDVGAGTVTLTNAAGTVTQSGAITADTLDLNGAATTWTLTTAANDIATLNASTDVLAALSYTDANAFDVMGVAATGTVTLSSASGLDTVTQSSGITAGALTLNGAAGTTYVLDDVTNAVTSLGADAGALASLTFDAAGGYDIAGIDASGLVTLTTTAGSVTQSGAITAGTLALNGGAGYTLGTMTNDVAALSGSTTGSVNYVDGNGFQVLALSASATDLDSVTGNIEINGQVSTTGTQTYRAPVLLNNGDRTLAGSTVNFASTLDGGGNMLSIVGSLDLDGAASNLSDLDVSATSNLGADVTTTGAQTYDGTATLSAGDRTLTGTLITLGGVTGAGNALVVAGDLDLNAAAAGLTTLSVSGLSDLGAGVASSGDQSYTGAVTVSGATVELESTTGTVQLVAGAAGLAGTENLDVTADLDLDGAVTNLATFDVMRTSNLAANVTTSGVQSYGGATTLANGPRTLSGSTVALGVVDGGADALTITGDLDLDGDATNLTTLNVTGASDLAANVSSTGDQSYTGAVTVSGATANLESTTGTVQLVAGAAGLAGTENLDVTADLDLDGAVTNLATFDVTGTSNLAADVTTSGAQSYGDATTLANGPRTLTGSAVTLGPVDGGADALTIAGDLDLDGSAGNLATLEVSGASDLAANVTTSGDQSYIGALTVREATVNLESTGGAVRLGAGAAGSGGTENLDVTGDLDLDGAVTNLATFDVTGTSSLAADVTTSGAQSYLGATTLGNGPRTLTGTVVALGAVDGGADALTVAGALDLNGNAGNLAALAVTGISDLGGNVTTTGTQTYGDTATLSGGARNLTGALIALNGISGAGNGLTVSGDLDLNAAADGLGSLSVAGASDLGANVASNGNQSYAGAVTVSGAAVELAAPLGTVRFQSTVAGAGGGEQLGISADLDLDGAVTDLASLEVTRTSSLAADVTTAGAQSYLGATTLANGPRTLTGAVVALGTVDGGADALTVAGALDLNGNAGNLTTLTVAGVSDLGGNVTTVDAQSYGDTATLSGGDRSLTGTRVTLDGVAGGGNALAISGDLVLDASASGLSSLSVSGTSELGAGVDSIGGQSYAGLVSLDAPTVTLGSGETVRLGAGATGVDGSRSLVIDGALDLDGALTTGIASLSVAGASNLGADVTSAGAQSFGGVVTLSGGNRLLTGTTVALGGVAGGGNALSVAGDLDLNGAAAGLTSIDVSGASDLGAGVATTSNQSYGGAATISGAAVNLNASVVNFASALTGTGTNALAIGGSLDLDGAASGLGSLSVTGTSNLGADVSTDGAQSYGGAVTLSGGDRTLAGSTVALGGVSAAGNALTIAGALDLNGAAAGLSSLSVSGTTDFGASVSSSGTQSYAGAATVGTANLALQASDVSFGSTVTGVSGAQSIAITGNLDLDGTMSELSTLGVSGTSNIGGDVATSGAQNYAGAVTLSGGDRTLAASTVNLPSGASGSVGNEGLTIDGRLDLGATLSDIGALAVSGTSALGADITSDGAQSFGGAVTLGADIALATSNDSITFLDVVNGARALTLNAGTANIAFNEDVGVAAALGAVTVLGAGRLSFGEDLVAASLSVAANPTAVGFTGDVLISGATSILSTGGTAFGDDGDTLLFAGGLDAAAGSATLDGAVQTAGTALALGDVTLAGASSVASNLAGNGAGADIGLGAVAAAGQALTIAAGSEGAVTIGRIDDAATVALGSAGEATVASTLQANRLNIGAVSALTVAGAITLGTLDTTAAGGADLTFNGGGTVTADTTFGNSGSITLGDGDGDLFRFGGGLDTRAGSLVLNADLATADQAIDVGTMTIAGDSLLDATDNGDPTAGGAPITLHDPVRGVAGGEALELRAGTGAVSVTAGVEDLGSLLVRSSGTLELGDIATNGNTIRGVASDDITVVGDLLDAQGDISLISLGGRIIQNAGTTIEASTGNVDLVAFSSIDVFDARAGNDLFLALLTPQSGARIGRVGGFGKTTPDLVAGGLVAVVTQERAELGSSTNGFRIDGANQFIGLAGGRAFIDASTATDLQLLPPEQQVALTEVVDPVSFPDRQAELLLSNQQFASLVSRAAANASATAASSQALQQSLQAQTQQSEEQETLSNLTEEVFIDIVLYDYDRERPLCLPGALQGPDAAPCVGAEGEETVAWYDRLSRDVLGAAGVAKAAGPAVVLSRRAPAGNLVSGAAGGG